MRAAGRRHHPLRYERQRVEMSVENASGTLTFSWLKTLVPTYIVFLTKFFRALVSPPTDDAHTSKSYEAAGTGHRVLPRSSEE